MSKMIIKSIGEIVGSVQGEFTFFGDNDDRLEHGKRWIDVIVKTLPDMERLRKAVFVEVDFTTGQFKLTTPHIVLFSATEVMRDQIKIVYDRFKADKELDREAPEVIEFDARLEEFMELLKNSKFTDED